MTVIKLIVFLKMKGLRSAVPDNELIFKVTSISVLLDRLKHRICSIGSNMPVDVSKRGPTLTSVYKNINHGYVKSLFAY